MNFSYNFSVLAVKVAAKNKEEETTTIQKEFQGQNPGGSNRVTMSIQRRELGQE